MAEYVYQEVAQVQLNGSEIDLFYSILKKVSEARREQGFHSKGYVISSISTEEMELVNELIELQGE